MDHYHLKEFSPDQKLFAIIQSDGKLKIWDVETSTMKQEYVPNLHLSTPCTALKWIRIGVGKKKKSRSSEGSLHILLGTSQGSLALYSYATAKIEATFKGKHSAAITSIDHDGNFVYTTGLDCQVIKWNIQSCQQEDNFECGKEKPTAICIIRNGQLIATASKEIKIWDGESHQLLHTFTGHSSNIILLKSFVYGEENFILSASKNDRNLSLWKIKEDKKSTAFGTFILLNNSPNCIDMQFTDDEELRIACICRNESMSYFEVNLKSIKSKKPIKSKFSLEIASASENSGTVAHLPINGVTIAGSELLIGYGDMIMKFETQPCAQDQANVVIVRKDPMKFEGSAKKDKKQQAMNESLKLLTPITDGTAEILNVISAKKKSQKSVEIPLETRLDNLTVGSGKRPNAKKLTYQLIQGLHGSDANILRTVLRQTDEETVRLTVKYLPTQYVMSFVNELSLLMSKKTAGSEIALTWLRYLIQTHSGSLMAYGATNLCNTFGTTLGIIDHRTQNLPKLMRLRGKLEILVSHLKQNSDLDEEIHNENVLVYEDSDDESNIDAKSNASSEQDVYQDFEDEEESNEENGMNGDGSENSEEEDEEMDIS